MPGVFPMVYSLFHGPGVTVGFPFSRSQADHAGIDGRRFGVPYRHGTQTDGCIEPSLDAALFWLKLSVGGKGRSSLSVLHTLARHRHSVFPLLPLLVLGLRYCVTGHSGIQGWSLSHSWQVFRPIPIKNGGSAGYQP